MDNRRITLLTLENLENVVGYQTQFVKDKELAVLENLDSLVEYKT